MKRRFRYPPVLAASLALVVAAEACGQTIEYIHTDVLGSPVAITNSSGVVIEQTMYEPYGAVVNRPLTNGPGFAGHVTDSVTGLVYMQQRYYDPMLGRFLSVDPVTADGVSGGNFNRYWYAANNPYRYRDPDGRLADSPQDTRDPTEQLDPDGAGEEKTQDTGATQADQTDSAETGADEAAGEEGADSSGDDNRLNGQPLSYNPDETGAGDKANRAVSQALAQEKAEERKADARARGDKAAERQAEQDAQRHENGYHRAIDQPLIDTGGINPPGIEPPNPYSGDPDYVGPWTG